MILFDHSKDVRKNQKATHVTARDLRSGMVIQYAGSQHGMPDGTYEVVTSQVILDHQNRPNYWLVLVNKEGVAFHTGGLHPELTLEFASAGDPFAEFSVNGLFDQQWRLIKRLSGYEDFSSRAGFITRLITATRKEGKNS